MQVKLSVLFVIMILVASSVVILMPGIENASAESMVHTTTADFESGDTTFVDISDGTLMLDRGLHLNFYDGGDTASDLYGNSVSGAGDVNGDGFADIIVGANGDAEVGGQGGAAFYYNGTNNGVDLRDRIKLLGEAANNEFGNSVAGAGDTNGDGYDDIIIGAWFNDDSASNAGKIYVYNGSMNGPSITGARTATGNTVAELFGNAVASAGDVNGDGYDDVIVGAVQNDDAGADTGKVYVYNGSFDGISISDPKYATGENDFDEFGWAVSGAGDVNGDGFDDVIIGVPINDDTGTDAGKAYVYLGSSNGLSATPSWTATGAAGGDNFGYSVSGAGDMNGDGFDDIIVGAVQNDDGGADAGKVYVYLGSWSGLGTTPAWNATGENAGDNLGGSAAGAGDVNGDGYDDVIIGSSKNDDAGPDAGKIYLYLGGSDGFFSLPHWTQKGEVSLDSYGISVSGAGDVDGDGFDDIIVGATGNDYIGSNSGKAYLYQYLTTTPLDKKIKWSAEGGWFSDQLGSSVAGAGDVNGDGYDDIITGAPKNSDAGTWAGKVYVYNGSENYQGVDQPRFITGQDINDEFGYSVDGAGDVNGDGYDDVIIGAPYNNTVGINSGKVYVYNGSATGLVIVGPWTAIGENADDQFGTVAGAGDTNGDGYDDIIVGAWGNDDSFSSAGKVYIYNGSKNGLSMTPQTILGEVSAYQIGRSVDSAGDTNGDGYDDIIVGSLNGGVYVFNGSAAGLSVNDRWSINDNNVNSWLGFSVAGAGDVNGDGFDDVLIGDHWNDTGGVNAGKAYLYFGSSSGLSYTAGWNALGEYDFDSFGFSVAGAGDVNNDGHDDIIIGASGNSDRGTFSGKTNLYLGSSSGPSMNPVWTDYGEPDDRFGSRVGSAGDFNNDGFNEIVIGSPLNDDSWSNAGKISIYTLPDYFGLGIYESPVFSSSGSNNLRWLSLEWEPIDQHESTSIRFQVGTSADGVTWTFAGSDGDTNSYFSNPRGEQINEKQLGGFWKYRAYLEAWDRSKTPTVESVTINFGFSEITKPSVTVTSPNGGEDWMKGDFYPLTWDAEGDFNFTPVQLYYSTDNGANWNLIAINVENIGVYNWTVPNIEASDALIAVIVTDIYGNWVVDTSDAGFAIDPPPIQAGGGDGPDTQLPDDAQKPSNNDRDTGGPLSGDTGSSGDGQGSDTVLILLILSIILVITVIIHVFLLSLKRSDDVRSAERSKLPRTNQKKIPKK